MKEIIYNKLVRDLIPDIIKKDGNNYLIHTANEKEYEEKLLLKLSEETNEFIDKPCEEEMADILEVIDCLIKQYGFNYKDINKLKKRKALLRGSFDNKIILDKVLKE